MPPNRPDGFAAGQVLGMLAILLISLPLLPLVLLLVAWIRLRDRLARSPSPTPVIQASLK